MKLTKHTYKQIKVKITQKFLLKKNNLWILMVLKLASKLEDAETYIQKNLWQV